MKTKLLCIVLAFVMCVSLLPTAALAAEQKINVSVPSNGYLVISVNGEPYGLVLPSSNSFDVEAGAEVSVRAISEYGYKLNSLSITHGGASQSLDSTFEMPNDTVSVCAEFDATSAPAQLSAHTRMLLTKYAELAGDTPAKAIEAMAYWFADPANETGVIYCEDLFLGEPSVAEDDALRYAKDCFYVSMLGLNALPNLAFSSTTARDKTDIIKCFLRSPILFDDLAGIVSLYGALSGEEENKLIALGEAISSFAADRAEGCKKCMDEDPEEEEPSCFELTKSYLCDASFNGNQKENPQTACRNYISALCAALNIEDTEQQDKLIGYTDAWLNDTANLEILGFSKHLMSAEAFAALESSEKQEYAEKAIVGTFLGIFKELFEAVDACSGELFAESVKALLQNMQMQNDLAGMIESVQAYGGILNGEDEYSDADAESVYASIVSFNEEFSDVISSLNWRMLQYALENDCAGCELFDCTVNDGVQTVKLTSNITAGANDSSLTVPYGGDVVLDLNGRVLAMNGNDSVITVNGKLSLKDSSSADAHFFAVDSETGLWTPVSSKAESDKSVTGGVITGGNAATGGAVNVRGGTFIQYGGGIVGNSADNGGGIFAAYGSTLAMIGGTVTGNTAGNGGGVYVSSEPACLASGTPITLADGTKASIENLQIGDEVRAFDHETGTVTAAKIFDLWKYPEQHTGAFTLHFTDGIDVTAVGGHCFFDKAANQYVAVTKENVRSYLGHEFYNLDGACWETLTGVDILDTAVDTYIIITENHLNCAANGMLSNEDGIYDILINLFAFGDGMKTDAAKKAADLETYGVWSLDNAQYMSEGVYEALGLRYMNVAFGKGLITPEIFAALEVYAAEIDPEWIFGTPASRSEAPALFSAFLMAAPSALPAADPTAPGVYFGGTAVVAGNIGGNLYLDTDMTAIPGMGKSGNGVIAPASGMRIGVTMAKPGAFAAAETDYSDGFFSDNPQYYVEFADGDKLQLTTETEKYDVWVGGTQITAHNQNDVLHDGGSVSFDDKTGVLTLNNAVIAMTGTANGRDADAFRVCGIASALDDLTLRLVGENRIGKQYDTASSPENYSVDFGVRSTGNVNFIGEAFAYLTIYDYLDGIKAINVTFGEDFHGKLTVFDAGGQESQPPCAINAAENVTIRNGTFDFISYESNGVTADKVEIAGGTVNVKGGSTGNAIFARTQLDVADTMEVINADYTKGTVLTLDPKDSTANGGCVTIRAKAPVYYEAPTVIVPVSGNGSSVKVSAEISGSTAALKAIKDADLDKVTGGEVVEIDLSGLNKNIDTTKIPTETVEKIGDKGGMSVKLTNSVVTFDQPAAQEIASQAEGSTVRLIVKNVKEASLNAAQQETVKKLDAELVIDAYLMSNGKKLCTESKGGFGGGKAIISLPFELKPGRSGANYKVFHVDEQGKLQEMNANYSTWNKSFEFEIEHFSNYVVANVENAYASCPKDATCPIDKFTDAKNDAWWHDGIHYCLDNGLMVGVSDTEFAPTGDITRGMIVTMLWRLDGQKYANYFMRFGDVPAGQWYTEAIRWAAAEKIVSGYDTEHFCPNDPITREQLATVLYNYAKYKGQGFTGSWMFLLDFVDRASISSWADEAAHWCSMKGVITGKDGKVFDPQGFATRAEAAAMMQRFCAALEK